MSLSIQDKAAQIRSRFEEKYTCEEITARSENAELIKSFSGGRYGRGLEEFLKLNAWSADTDNRSKVYLVKDKTNGCIKAYFSIKCGMLYSPYLSQRLEGADRDFFELVLDAMRENDEDLLTDYSASGYYEVQKFKKLYDEARRIVDHEKSLSEGGTSKSFDVAQTFPAIEIENLCKNHDDQPGNNDEKIPLGFLVFWIYIIPMIQRIAQTVGCEYIYIFAADQSKKDVDTSPEIHPFVDDIVSGGNDEKAFSLISHYRTNYGFHDADELFFVRPKYDDKCYEMVQSVKEAIENSQNIWEQFDDVLDKAENIEDLIP